MLVATSPTKFVARRVPLVSPLDGGAIANSPTVAYLSNAYGLVAVNDAGLAFPAGYSCENPTSVAPLPGGDAIATCEFGLVRYHVPR